MDVCRLSPQTDPTGTTINQVKGVVELLPADREVPLFVFDAGYDGIALAEELSGERAEVLVRISSSRVFHHDPAPRDAEARGRPSRHGTRFVCSDEATWTPPDHEIALADPSYGAVRVQVWCGLHPKLHGRGRRKGADELPIVRAPSSASTSSTSRNRVAGQTRHCGCGGPDPARWTSNDAFVPTCGALTSSTMRRRR